MEKSLEQNGQEVYSNQAYNEKRSQLVGLLAQVNSIANVNGKGRSDLTDISILRAAETLSGEVPRGQAMAIQVLAEKIRQSLRCFRVLVRRYSENIDAVDPQLRNNKELLEIVEIYENSWALGKDQLLDSSHKSQLVNFSLCIEQLCARNKTFRDQVESFEADIFLSIPSLLVLWSVKSGPMSSSFKDLCSRFSEDVKLSSLEAEFSKLGDQNKIIGQLEKFIIEDDGR